MYIFTLTHTYLPKYKATFAMRQAGFTLNQEPTTFRFCQFSSPKEIYKLNSREIFCIFIYALIYTHTHMHACQQSVRTRGRPKKGSAVHYMGQRQQVPCRKRSITVKDNGKNQKHCVWECAAAVRQLGRAGRGTLLCCGVNKNSSSFPATRNNLFLFLFSHFRLLFSQISEFFIIIISLFMRRLYFYIFLATLQLYFLHPTLFVCF